MKENVLVLGLGAYAYGKERRAIFTFKHMPRIKPFYAVSKWEDGSVSLLLKSEEQESFDAPFGYLGRAKPLWTLVAFAHLPLLWYRIIRICLGKKCRSIVFLCLSSFTSAFLPAILLEFFWKVKIVFYMGDIPKKNFPYRMLGQFVNKLSSHVIANSEAVKRGFVGIGVREEKIKVVYNGKVLQSPEKFSRMNFRDRFGFSTNDILVAFLGQLSPNKGIEDFIEAATEVLHRQNNCRFVIVGDATALFKDFERKLRESVQALGLTHSIVFTGRMLDVESVYESIDMVVVPSRHEDPAPNVIVEAMSYKVPVIATRVGGSIELVEEGQTGFLVEKKSPSQIAQTILRLIKDPVLRIKMGLGGRRYAEEKFDIISNALLVERAILSS
ncbi:MAG: glycosyltransferase [Chlamydiae bacterium]|nr:glycosyltransferase [Chlamydiota bacterium]MBI3276204.1 glycosyltransferase [Chlamydiota bacterium]